MRLSVKEFLRKKRDQEHLREDEIDAFIQGIQTGLVSDEQLAAFAMAVFLNGFDDEETVYLTRSMKNSGKVLNWSNTEGPLVDKHSTGGVGDKASLILGPIVAACGCKVPMISGRSLGHTGGTLDKLESIPGYNTSPDIETFNKIVNQTGCCIIGQTKDMAPADKRLYAVRDITSTVESIPLITASILSKKLCSGIGGLTMDIKVGNGAFMSSIDDAQQLGEMILKVARMDGIKAGGLITDMNQPLGKTVGNALEVIESIEFLIGIDQEPRLYEVTIELAAHMLEIAGVTDNRKKALKKAQTALDSGQAAEKFSEMVRLCGGPKDLVKNYRKILPTAQVIEPIICPKNGYLSSIDTRRVGELLITLGGGRKQSSEKLDFSVGFSDVKSLGEKVGNGEPLAFVHAANKEIAEQVKQEYLSQLTISPNSSPPFSPIIKHLD